MPAKPENATPDGTEWLTRGQAAEFLGIEPQTVSHHIKYGHLRARKLGREWMIHPAALREFIKSKWHRPGRPPKPAADGKPAGA
jgi:excisionase family DNA binding protein